MTSLMSPFPEKMTRPELEKKCLELSQALVNKGHPFNFSMTSGDFSFSLDSRGTTNQLVARNKKLSPSQIRRNLRRKEAFLKKKSEQLKDTPEEVIQNDSNADMELETAASVAKNQECNICQQTFKTENGLKIHKGKTHNKEVLRSQNPEVTPLETSPVKEGPREEECVCCGDVMSPNHQCEENDFNCKGCEMEFNCEEDLTKHEMTLHPNMCHICYQLFEDKETRYKHFVEMCFKPNQT